MKKNLIPLLFLSSTSTISSSSLIFEETIPSNILSTVTDHNGGLPIALSFDFLNNRGDPTFIQGNYHTNEVDIIVGFDQTAKKVRKLITPVKPFRNGFGSSVALVSSFDRSLTISYIFYFLIC